MCSLAIKTSGKTPYNNCILEVVALPFDRNFKLNSSRGIFTALNLKPTIPYNDEMTISHDEYIQRKINGVDPMYYADLFEQWKVKLGLPETHPILTLTYKPYTFTNFMTEWLGFTTFNFVFGDKIRAIDTFAQMYKDCTWYRADDFLFNQTTYMSLANDCGVEASLKDSTWQRAVNYMLIYCKLLEKGALYERTGAIKR
jgi:hypothetical protein